ncbi:MAG: MCE family protein [Deltaproteobacteria bacterium]|nr:MCE family protein [Deltaproteobacteria bacterium]
MAGISTEAKVGVFVLAALAVLAYFTLRLGKFDFAKEAGYPVWAVFDQAGGLQKDSPVEMAGIQIGKVTGVELYEGRARVNLLINPGVKLTQDARAAIRTRGILGDKYLALQPGQEAAPPLAPGGRLRLAENPTDLDAVMARIGEVADNIKEITDSLKVSIASPESQANIHESLGNLKELTASLKTVVGDNQQRLNQIVVNLEDFTGTLKEFSSDNRQAIDDTIVNFRNISKQMQTTMVSLNQVLGKINSGDGTLGALLNERGTVDQLNQALTNLNQVSAKINQGQGSLGKLVNDDTTVTKIDEALTSINDFLARGDAWKVYMDYRGEYLFEPGGLRSYVNLRFQPRADKFYLLGVVSDPVGLREEMVTTTTTNEDGVVSTKTVKQVKRDKDQILFNAQFGKRIYDATFRAGVFQSTGGVGVDYHLLDDRLTLSLEAFDFSSDYNPHLKFAADYHFLNYFTITAGYDDFLDEEDGATFFLGGGFSFYDDDIKFLLTKAPVP